MFNRRLGVISAANSEALSPAQAVAGCVGSDRRASTRYRAAKNEAQFRWSAAGLETISAELINVSYTGALAVIGSRLPANSHIEFRLTQPNATAWTEVKIVQISLAPGRKFQVRLTFSESCPYEFFRSAVDGFTTAQ